MPGPTRDYKRPASGRQTLTLSKGFPFAKYGPAGPAISLLTGKVVYEPPKRRTFDPPAPKEPTMDLTSRGMKVTVVLNAHELKDKTLPTEKSVTLNIALGESERSVKAAVSGKTMRKVIAAVAEHGPDGVAIVLQGRLMAHDRIQDAGVSAMPKMPKPAAQEAA